MFKNILKKVQQSLEPIKDPNVLIAEIHNEFDTSTERLLKEAKEIISKSDKSEIDKSQRLKNLGFKSSKFVTETNEKIKEEKESKELADSILYFQQWYPNNKFITEKEVAKVCAKYKLIFAEVRYYKGDVPEKNITEIENFILREEDMLTKSNYDDYIEPHRRMQMFGGLAQAFGDRQRPRYTPPPPPTEYKTRSVKPELKICAPEKDFDTRYMTISEGYKLVNIPDPIVLQPVKGGYLIISKWGLESEDENLVNEKMN